MDKDPSKVIQKLQTFAEDPELAKFEELQRVADLLEPLFMLGKRYLDQQTLGKTSDEYREELSQQQETAFAQLTAKITGTLTELEAKLTDAVGTKLNDEKAVVMDELTNSVARLGAELTDLVRAVSPKPGKDFPTYTEVKDFIRAYIPDDRTIATTAINLLEGYEGDAKLDAKALRNLEAAIDVKKLDITPYDDKSLRDLIAELRSVLEEVASRPPRIIERYGRGGGVSEDRVLELIEENAGTGGGSTVTTPVGTVDAVNQSFTVAATPKWIVADGIMYFDGAGYSVAGLTVTMDVPPSQFIRSVA